MPDWDTHAGSSPSRKRAEGQPQCKGKSTVSKFVLPVKTLKQDMGNATQGDQADDKQIKSLSSVFHRMISFHSFIIVLPKQRLIARITYDFLSFGYQSLVLVQVRDTQTKPHLKITDRLCDLHNHQLWQHRNWQKTTCFGRTFSIEAEVPTKTSQACTAAFPLRAGLTFLGLL